MFWLEFAGVCAATAAGWGLIDRISRRWHLAEHGVDYAAFAEPELRNH